MARSKSRFDQMAYEICFNCKHCLRDYIDRAKSVCELKPNENFETDGCCEDWVIRPDLTSSKELEKTPRSLPQKKSENS